MDLIFNRQGPAGEPMIGAMAFARLNYQHQIRARIDHHTQGSIMRQIIRHSYAWLLLAVLFVHSAFGQTDGAGAAAPPSSSELHGFTVDFHLASEADKSTTLPSLTNQLAIVESVGLPEKILAFLRTVPILVDPSLKGMPGQYTAMEGKFVVRVRPIELPNNKPIVLHELLHAYHHQVLTLANKDIESAYQRAMRPGVYPENFRQAHFLENEKEYFAILGTIYLFGDIQQPPFNCQIPSRYDPELMVFFAEHFGPHKCQ